MRAAVALVACLLGASASAAGPLVVIDAGHGGTQEGALGAGGLKEKDISLQIAEKLKEVMRRQLDARVVLTRDKDSLVHLSERVALANRQKPDVFVSVHANSMPTRRQRARSEGIETFFLSASASDEDASKTADRENAEFPQSAAVQKDDALAYILADLQRAEAQVDSSRLAYAIHQKLIATTGAVDRGVQQAPFYVLMGVEAPSVLVEVGFISHPKEGKRLADAQYQQALAEAIGDGVRAFLEQVRVRDSARAVAPAP
jgi:N-acetylmuramoyl-L-alanine amidase